MHADKEKGVLYLIPTSLGETSLDSIWPAGHHDIINRLSIFIVENLRTARRFLRSAGYTKSFDAVTFHLLNKHISEAESAEYLHAVPSGASIGLLSEAGCPCIADPGQIIVAKAHQEGIRVVPLAGPNSIIMGLMASGMNGQSFVFHGYLPKQQHERIKVIKHLESSSRRTGATQIFMETPFRNNQLTGDLLQHCHPGTLLCIAADISTHNEYIRTCTIGHWRNTGLPDLNKRPAIFLISA